MSSQSAADTFWTNSSVAPRPKKLCMCSGFWNCARSLMHVSSGIATVPDTPVVSVGLSGRGGGAAAPVLVAFGVAG